MVLNEVLHPHFNATAINEVFVGRKIVKADMAWDTIHLDNGTIVEILPHIGFSESRKGDFYVAEMSPYSDIIRTVEVQKHRADNSKLRYVYSIVVTSDEAPESQTVLEVEGIPGDDETESGFLLRVIS